MPTAAPATTGPHWHQAMEFMLSQIVFVLDAKGARGFSANALNRWLDICTARMQETGSAPAALIAEVRALQARVLA